MKPKKEKVTGYVVLAGDLVPCVLSKRYPTGRKQVILAGDKGAYQAGDRVVVGPGQFIKTNS